MSVKLTIDGRRVEVPGGSSVLDAARQLGINLPTMCYLEECGPITSCMVCAVKDVERGRMVPACAAPAVEGMVIDTLCDEVVRHRRAALELLLSEHGGDCEGPCRRGCPAWMDIPEMIRQIVRGDLRKAIEVIKEDIPLPAVLGRICPAPCERICRRTDVDEAVGICLLKRYAADADLGSGAVYIPACAEETGKRVAVIGGGPAGLSAAYFLRRQGHAVKIFEQADRAGGALRGSWAQKYDIEAVLDAEIDLIVRMGVDVSTGCAAGVDRLAGEFDAVIDASGFSGKNEAVKVYPHTFETDRKGVFAAGGSVRQLKMAVMAVAHGHGAACSVDQFLRGKEIEGRVHRFDSHLHGKPGPDELKQLMQVVGGEDCRLETEDGRLGDEDAGERTEDRGQRTEVGGQTAEQMPKHPSTQLPKGEENGDNLTTKYTRASLLCSYAGQAPDAKGEEGSGMTRDAAGVESARCMECDCMKKDGCALRDYSESYGAKQDSFPSLRAKVELDVSHEEVVYEPGKCIKCGLCVAISRKREGSGGVGFINRGMETRMTAPFGEQIARALRVSGVECAEKCPTGALSRKTAG